MSMHHQRGGRVLLAGAATAALLLGGALGASADPINPATGQPDLSRTVDGTGSDTTQDVVNGLAAVVTNADEELFLGSWDATIPAGDDNFIQTRTCGTWIPRPNGSSQGVAALRAAVNETVLTNPRGTSQTDNAPCGGAPGPEDVVGPLTGADLQFARSSSGIDPNTTGALSYVPFAVDAVTYSVHEENTTLPRDLTRADLIEIYTASNGATVTLSTGTYTVGVEGSGADIVPFIPQAGSGTRSFWVDTVIPDGEVIGSAVADSFIDNGTGEEELVQEHDGSVLADVPNAITPFSIAQYVAQTRVGASPTYYSDVYGVTVNDRRDGAELAEINNVQPIVGGVLNTAFPVKRAVFNVVEHAAVTPGSDVRHAFWNDPATTAVEGAIYSAVRPGTPTLVVEDFGFGSLGDGIEIDGVFYEAGDIESFRTN